VDKLLKYSHLVAAFIVSGIVIVVGGSTGFMPYRFSIPVAATILLVAGSYLLDYNIPFLNGSFSGNRTDDLIVHPNDVLQWLDEEKIPEIEPYRKLDMDSTSLSNQKFHTRIKKVNENGELKTKFGVVGRPLNQMDRESIAYVVHCDTGFIEYSGELHSAEDRLDPFNGKHKWLVNSGYKAKVEDTGDDRGRKGSVNIYQGDKNFEEE
jgi:hypothetical protein